MATTRALVILSPASSSCGRSDVHGLVEYPGIGHFDIYTEEHFETAANEAADWFREHLGLGTE